MTHHLPPGWEEFFEKRRLEAQAEAKRKEEHKAMLAQKEKQRKRKETLGKLVEIINECQQLDMEISSLHNFASFVKSQMEEHTMLERNDSINEISTRLQSMKNKIDELCSRMEHLDTLGNPSGNERGIENTAANEIKSLTDDRLSEIEGILVSLHITATTEEAENFETLEPELEPVSDEEIWYSNNP